VSKAFSRNAIQQDWQSVKYYTCLGLSILVIADINWKAYNFYGPRCMLRYNMG